jgi:hypothetical protein
MKREWYLPGVDGLGQLQCQAHEHCPEPARYEARFLCCNAQLIICSGHRAQRRRQEARGEPAPCPTCGTPTADETTTWRSL